LIAAASKNDPALVRRAFERPDLLLKPGEIFPIEAHWGAKSESVRHILAAWNIAAGDVVFVDDSRMEVAEVAERHPGMECLCFPAGDPGATLALLRRLRTFFAKPHATAEDRLRLESLRGRAAFEEARSAEAESGFFSRLEATVTLEFSSAADDARAFELVNKTNQFNLNGRRFTEREWRGYFQTPGAFLVTASYEDRFGPLGKIAVLAGRRAQESIHVDVWVMSCRAFSRHIEYQVLARLFARSPGCTIDFAYQATERNGPWREFIGRLSPPGAPLTAARFVEACPELHHRVVETHHG
jgi:FkbH-like protein